MTSVRALGNNNSNSMSRIVALLTTSQDRNDINQDNLWFYLITRDVLFPDSFIFYFKSIVIYLSRQKCKAMIQADLAVVFGCTKKSKSWCCAGQKIFFYSNLQNCFSNCLINIRADFYYIGLGCVFVYSLWKIIQKYWQNRNLFWWYTTIYAINMAK